MQAAREAVLAVARGAFDAKSWWMRLQAYLNAARELVEAEAAAEAPTQPDLRLRVLPEPPPER